MADGGIQHASRTAGDVINSSAVWSEDHEWTDHLLPNGDGALDIGSASRKVRAIFLPVGGLGGAGVVEDVDLAADAITGAHASIEHLSAMLAPAIQQYNTDITFSPYGTVGGSPDSHDSVEWSSGTVSFADGSTQSIDAGNEEGLAAGIHYIYFTTASATLTVTNAYDQTSTDTKSLLAWIGVSATATQEINIQTFQSKGININADAIAANAILTAHLSANQVIAGKISVVGLDGDGKLVLGQVGSGNLDNIDDGATWSRVATTDIDAGHIKLSEVIQGASYRTVSDGEKGTWNGKPDNMDQIGEGATYERVRATSIDAGYIELNTQTRTGGGEWYDEGGVEIDASHGINIYGSATAFTTRPSKAGAIQCSMDAGGKIVAAAGKVTLSASGINIWGLGNALTTRATEAGAIQCAVNASGHITAGAGAVVLASNGITINGQVLFLQSGGVTKGHVYASGNNVTVACSAGSLILSSLTTINIYSDIIVGFDSTYDIGTAAGRIKYGYFDDVRAAYNSDDGSAGITTVKSWFSGVGVDEHTVTVKDGIITSWAVA